MFSGIIGIIELGLMVCGFVCVIDRLGAIFYALKLKWERRGFNYLD